MRTILTLIVLLIAGKIYSQQTNIVVSGTIKSETGESVSGVSVLIFKPHSNNPSWFCISDKEGWYNIKINNLPDSFKVKFSSIGYKDSILLCYKRNIVNNSLNLSVSLFTIHTELTPVTIEARPDILVRGDTTIFNAQRFGSETEQKVENLLKNLPGMQVDDNGNLRFKGKVVSKVMIENDDLFGNNYKLLTQNLAANTLLSVEAIENDNENPVLKDFDFNKQTVLNLKLKKQFLVRVFGEINAAGGIEGRYVINNFLFSLVKRFKFSIINNLNNTGKDIKKGMDADETTLASLVTPNSISVPFSLNTGLIRPIGMPGLSTEKFNNNQDKAVAVNFISRLSSHLEIKGGVSYLFFQTKQNQLKETEFLNALNLFKLDEFITFKDRGRSILSQFKTN